MIGRRVIPCLLLKDRGLYKTVRFSDPKYVGDPINAVRIFNDKEVDEIVVLDIGASGPDELDLAMIEDFATECFMPLCYGGGIRTMDDARRLFELGVEKVCINTAAVTTPDLIEEIVEVFGSQSVVVSIDVKSFRFRGPGVVIRGGRERTGLQPVEHAREVARRGAGELLLTSVDREGTGSGLDLDLLREVTSSVSVPVIAHGGVGNLSHLAEAFSHGASAAAAGSLFVFEGPHRAVLINYPSQDEQEAAFGLSA
jgi:cyclase